MFRALLPRKDVFFDFFENHAKLSFAAAQELARLGEPTVAHADIFTSINDFEHAGDRITHQCVEVLHTSFITPMDRMEIYRLMTTLDDILDEIEDIAKLIVTYKLYTFSPAAGKLAQLLVESTREIHLAVRELRKMKITEGLKGNCFRINDLENEADTIYLQGVETLFAEESDIKQLIKWKEVYEHFEAAIDVCEDAANIIEGVILENE
jgi:predicted phosphate transport protein (TIGR00153 family)